MLRSFASLQHSSPKFSLTRRLYIVRERVFLKTDPNEMRQVQFTSVDSGK